VPKRGSCLPSGGLGSRRERGGEKRLGGEEQYVVDVQQHSRCDEYVDLARGIVLAADSETEGWESSTEGRGVAGQK